MYLVRKITRAKWEPPSDLASDEIPADAVTVDLRTRKNTLSFWEAGNATPPELEDAVLALAAGRDRLDRIEVVWLAEEDLRGEHLSLCRTEGCTPMSSMVKHHVDVSCLDYKRLGRVAQRIAKALKQGRYQRLTKKRARHLLAQAVREGRLRLEDLEAKLRKELGQILEPGAT